jgi:hypothetical protein
MLPQRPQYGMTANCDIAQQYSSSSIVSLHFQSRNHNIGVGHKYVIIVIIIK